MREMKNSGIEWLNQIPVSWKNETIRHLITTRDGGAWGDEPSEDNGGTICLRIADFDYSKGTFQKSDQEALTRREYSSAQIQKLKLQAGDILIEKSGGGEKTPVGRSVIYHGEYGAVLFANFMERLRFDTSVVLPEFAEYWLRAWYSCRCSPYYINQTTGIQNINLTLMLAKERIFFPEICYQQVITAYLDSRCAEIDAVAADIQSQIDVLEQYRRSVITETVTKGLNPDAEMKDSGIEWCARIPSHWKVMANKYIMKKIKEIQPIYDGEDILSLTMNGVIVRDLEAGGKMPTSFDGYQKIKSGNLLMCLFDIDVTPRCVGMIRNNGVTSPAYSQFVMRDIAHAPYYYYYYLMLDFTKELLHMAKNLRHSLTEDQLGAINAPVPPLREQQSIAKYLDSKCTEIDSTIEIKKFQLETLEEYKKSLIFEYVTGKKEVPA
jgi:type I restriction enzyme S subunit